MQAGVTDVDIFGDSFGTNVVNSKGQGNPGLLKNCVYVCIVSCIYTLFLILYTDIVLYAS